MTARTLRSDARIVMADGIEMDVYITLDDEMPTHALYLSYSNEATRLNVTVSPQVDPPVIANLQPELTLVVAGALDADRAQQASDQGGNG
jgi:hypothetical protein